MEAERVPEQQAHIIGVDDGGNRSEDRSESKTRESPDSTTSLRLSEDLIPSLDVFKVVSLTTGFKLILGISSSCQYPKELDTLRRVGIFIGYIIRDPSPIITFHPNKMEPRVLPSISVYHSDSGDSCTGELILMLVDSRKNWNFPYGRPCSVDAIWPSLAGKNNYYCELHVGQLRSFREYNVTIKVDSKPLETSLDLQRSRIEKTFSFRYDVNDAAILKIRTLKGPPSAPKYIHVVLQQGYEALDSNSRRRTIRVEFLPGESNGGEIFKYDVQRLILLQSSWQYPELDVMSWKDLVSISSTSPCVYFDKEMIEPFVVQYRVRAVSDVGSGQFIKSLEVSNDSGMILNPLDEYRDPTKPPSNSLLSSLPPPNSIDRQNLEFDKVLGSLLERKGKIKNYNLDEVDRKWLERLSKAGPFSN